MKRRLLHFAWMSVALLLCLATLMGTATLLSRAEETAEEALDFGDSRTQTNEEIDATELFSTVTGRAPTGAEKTYLEELCAIRLRYNASIPSRTVSTTYDRETGTLDVVVEPYSYTAKNGATVTWTPLEAVIDGKTERFDAANTCRLEGLSHLSTGDFTIEVTFKTTLTLPQKAAGALVNAAHTAGSEMLEVLKNHEREYAAWEARNEAYLAYVAYLDAVVAFENYTEAMRVYEAEMEVYRQYVKEYEQYRATLRIYEDWRQYYAYQKFLEAGVEQYQRYLEYRSQRDKVIAKLDVMEKLFVTDSNHWQLYASLMGDTVTQVVSRREELITAGCNAQDINAAGTATEELRVLMKGYADLRKLEYPSEHARITALYQYYTQNYTALRDGYKKLYGALISLYDNSLVVSALDMEGKLAHFQQFVGQLYYTATCLDDSVKTSDAWTISKKPLTTVVEECHRVSDTNTASPAGVSMPATEVAEVQKVDPIDEPKQPDPIVRPTEPTAVPKPIEPQTVADPSLSPIPDAAEDPGASPTPPQADACLLALAEQVREGTLKERTTDGMKLTLDLTTVCSRLVSIDNKKLVTFYDSDRKTVLYQITLEYGSPITYLGPDVSKKQDAHYNYEFYRWENADYTPAQMVATSDLSLYARYWQHERFYTVTWILDGVSYDEQYNYGVTPVSPFPSEKAENEGYTYRFSGWSSASYEEGGLHPVTGNVTYTARFEPIPKQFTVTWIFEGIDGKNVVVEEQYEYLAYPRYTGNTEYADSNYRYTFKGWQETVQSVKGNASYHARIEKTPLAVTDAGETLNVTHTSDALTVDCTADRVDIREAAQSANTAGKRLVLAWEEFTLTLTPDAVAMLINSPCRKLGITQKEVTPIGTVYTVGFFNSLNYSISPTFSVLLESRSEANSPMAAYLLRDGEWQSIGDTAAELQGSASFRIARLASITVLPVSNCDLSQLVRMAEVGKTVDLKLGCKFGFEVSSAVVRLADGTPIEVKDLTFVMPNGDVTVELTVSQIVYHVSFVVDGVVILEKDYLLGEQIVAPADPTKASDGVFDYTFGGWSKSVTVAYGADRNPIFEAVFVATEIPKVDPYKSLHNNNLFLTVILPIFLSVVAAGVIALIVLKTLKKRKLRRAQESESTAPDTDNDSATNSATDDGQANATPSSANEKNAPEKEAE